MKKANIESRGSKHQHHDHDHDGIRGEYLTTLTSVGIDIGSSTSHLMFSRLHVGFPSLHRRHPEVLERRVLSHSAVLLTPFTQDWTIELEPLKDLIQTAYEQAGLTPQDIDTGAVIITGEAARRHNARRIADLFSDEAGRFVCATAGPRLETVLGAHGSGAVHLSREQGLNLMNIDVGGGTTKVGLISKGRLIDAAAFNIGSRLVAFDEEGTLTRVEKAGRKFLDELGYSISIGDKLDSEACALLSHRMVKVLFGTLQGEEPPWMDLTITRFSKASPLEHIDGVLFSGGVAEYIYGREPSTFGDLGAYMGKEIKKQAQELGLQVFEADEGLRATVIGASQYSMQMSGETIYVPDANGLPFRNLRVFPVSVSWQPPVAQGAEMAFLASIRSIDPEVKGEPFALAVASPPFLGYGLALELAEGIRAALERLSPQERPVALVFEQNIGRVVGESLAERFKLLCIDEVSLSELDFVDIGQPVSSDSCVPVVVKSLAFGV